MSTNDKDSPLATTIVTLPEQLGAALRTARLERGLSQDDLALRIGSTQRTVSLLENETDGRTLAILFRALTAMELELRVEPRPVAGDGQDPGPTEW